MTYGRIADCSVKMLGTQIVDSISVFKGDDVEGPTLEGLKQLFDIQHSEVEVALIDACMHYYALVALGGADNPLANIPFIDVNQLVADGAPRFFWGLADTGFTRALYQEDFGIVTIALAVDMNPKALHCAFKQLAIAYEEEGDTHKPYNTSLGPSSYGLDTDACWNHIKTAIERGWEQATPAAVDRAAKIWYKRFSDCFSVSRDFSDSDTEEAVMDDARTTLENVELCLWRRMADNMAPTALLYRILPCKKLAYNPSPLLTHQSAST